MPLFQHTVFLRLRTLAFGVPRRPRHPLLRLLLGLLGLALLLILVVLGVLVGSVMLVGGMLWRLWARRGRNATTQQRRGRTFDGDYRVVGKPQLPLAR